MRIPDYGATEIINDTTVRIYEFGCTINPEYQNLMLIRTKLESITSDFDVFKETVTSSVPIGNKTSFNIIVKNNGTISLNNVTVYETEYEGLKFNSWKSNYSWTYKLVDDKPVWTLNRPLYVNETVTINVVFDTTELGNFTNVVIVGSNETGNKTTNNTTNVNNDTPKNPNNNTPENPSNDTPGNPNNNIPKNSNSNIQGNPKNSSVNNTVVYGKELPKTGNPLVLLLFSLACIPLYTRRRK
ncbi:hypothetical protein BGI41_07525 [Methanobrevibacter sp. 87.7]|uniref:DUF11 domain-containing protein n=1 Tax=Methanobrevibacter sp. 87.7 TaxID=387957 RepID=UPI000B509EAC|nr:DUF11 domain-containing protein [Methanobrevibacter sp. 87.7]OWT32464.1 hypothetical protein BGI41_07525 [Methanobrevibacter sp. 87.7]